MPSRLTALGLIALLGASFGVSQFIRTAPAVLAPELRRELGLSPETIGLVFGLFFVAFTLVHLPVGALLDRYGPRRVMCVMLFVSSAGTFVFATGADARAFSRLTESEGDSQGRVFVIHDSRC